jgi:two-component system OmpR family sensor kinase
VSRPGLLQSFYGKLALVLLLVVASLGAVSLMLTLHSSQRHSEEVRQRLNHDVAQHIAKDLRPFGAAGTGALESRERLDMAALKSVFMTVMTVNPSLEVYLLDLDGRILAFDAPPERVVRRRVDLAPVEAFLAGHPEDILRGDDPRSQGRRKVFSAWPVSEGGEPRGYLYIILGGEEYDSIASLLETSEISRATLWILLVSVLVATLAGLAAFSFLTRPLRRLHAAFEAFQHDDLDARVRVTSPDELGRLSQAFNAMADRIVVQVTDIRRTDEQRRELVASISHDLRTPLAALRGFLETKMVKEASLSREQHISYTEMALRNANRLSKLVTDLFELSRFDAGEVQMEVEQFSLPELVQDIIQERSLQVQREGLGLSMSSPEQLPSVRGDIGLIERVLGNLLDNAIRYTPRGGRVMIELVTTARAVEVRVTDTGCGMPREELSRIFERFHRVERSRSDDSGGAGLGLAITKRILDLHGSRIRVKSRPDVGTMIAFTLAA